MQKQKARPNSSEVPQKRSPTTTRTARQLNISGSDQESPYSSSNNATRTPKDKSPKTVNRRSPRNSGPELACLQEELKNVQNQLNLSKLEKLRAQEEAEEARKQLLSVSKQLSESQQKLLDLSASEDARFQELRKISQERDRAWQSELKAVQKQQSLDSAALNSSLNEVKRLKLQLERAVESEATQTKHAESAYHELQHLREELSETLVLMENLKTELCDCRDSEARALEMVANIQMQLEIANATAETLHSETMKAREALNAMSSELEQSKAREKALEAMMSNLQEDLDKCQSDDFHNTSDFSIVEAGHLNSALETSRIRYYEQPTGSTVPIPNPCENEQGAKVGSLDMQAELEANFKKAIMHIAELSAKIRDEETAFQKITEENKNLRSILEINSANAPVPRASVEELETSLMDKVKEVQELTEENEVLKEKISKQDIEKKKAGEEAAALLQAARLGEQEALLKLGCVTEEADKSSKRVAQLTRQLDAAEVANMEIEAELRRLKVQLDQWRKAAEAAAAMVSGANDGRFVSVGNSPFSEDFDDDDDDGSPKKRNGNMLKKIGVLWKKGQK